MEHRSFARKIERLPSVKSHFDTFSVLSITADTTMAAAMTSQAALVQRLSALFGFEDGVNDVLEHLLSIESSQVCFPKRISSHLTLHASLARTRH